MRSSLHIRNSLLLVLVVLILLTAGCEKKRPRLQVGQKLPDITVNSVIGNDVHLREFIAGKLGILLFWEKGCRYCKEEMPLLEPLYTKYRDEGVVFVGIHVGPAGDAITQIVSDNSLTFPMFEDKELRSRQTYGLVAVPSMMIVKPDGTVDEKVLGGLPADAIETLIREKL